MTLPLNVRVHDIMRVFFRVLFVPSEETDLAETAYAVKPYLMSWRVNYEICKMV